jgi:DNA polymerase I
MDFELHPAITLCSRAFHILVSPLQMLTRALNDHLDLQRFEVLYICGNYSRILSGLDRRFTSLQVRRAFTVFQLMTILEENRHTLLIIEHDPLLYEDAEEMVEYVSQAMREATKSSTVLLYSPASDKFLEMMTNYADRVFYFAKGPSIATKPSAKSCRKAQASSTGGQTTLEAF